MNDSQQSRIYFNIEKQNTTDQPIQANYDSGILTQNEFIKKASDYEVAVVRFRCPSSLIPIFPDNLPFDTLKIGLSYNNISISETVQQYNAQTSPAYYYTFDSAQPIINKYQINSDGTLTLNQTYRLPNTSNDLTAGRITGMEIYNDAIYLSFQGRYLKNNIVKTDGNFTTFDLVKQTTYTDPNFNGTYWDNIQIDAGNRLLISHTVNGYIHFFDLETNNTLYEARIDFQARNMVLSPNTTTIYLTYSTYVNLYSYTRTGDVITIQDLGQLVNLPLFSWSNTLSYMYVKNDFIYITPQNYYQIDHAIYRFSVNGGPNAPLDRQYKFSTPAPYKTGGISVDDNYIFCLAYQDQLPPNIQSIQISTGIENPTTSPFPVGQALLGGYVQPAGFVENKIAIYKIAEFVACINNSYNRAFQRLSGLTSIPPGLKAPWVYFDAGSKLFSIYANIEYSSNSLNVFMNADLYKYFQFLAIKSDISGALNGFYNITFNDYTINEVVIADKTYLQMQQEHSTLSIINQLTKIVVASTSLPIIGDVVENTTVNYISDFMVDTDSFLPGSVIILAPSLLRLYGLYSNTPIRQVQCSLYYTTNNTEFKPVLIAPGESWSAKLEFRNKSATSSF